MGREVACERIQPVSKAPIDTERLARVPLALVANLPAQSGIYLAIDDAIRVWYVGIAESLRDRLKGHDRIEDFKRRNVTAIGWILEEADAARRATEKTLIEFFHPPLNNRLNYNALPIANLGLSAEEEIERFLQLRVQLKLIELELIALKPNLVTRCEEKGGKLLHPLGSISCRTFKTWQYSDDVENLSLKLKQMQQQERQTGQATVKKETLSPVAVLSGDAISKGIGILLNHLNETSEELSEAV